MKKISLPFCLFCSSLLLTTVFTTAAQADGGNLTNPEATGYGHTTAVCDVNGDKIDDLVVGTYWFENHLADVYLGPVSSSTKPISLKPKESLTSMGIDVACAGDLNSDGYDDLLLTTAGESVDIIFGAKNFSADKLERRTLTSQSTILKAKPIGDINKDGKPDIAIVTPEKILVYLKDPGEGELNTGDAITITSGNSTTLTQVSTAGDVNGDGIDDFAIGAPNDSSSGKYSGTAWVLTEIPTKAGSNVNLSDGFKGFAIHGPASGSSLVATSISPLGDINNDGYADLLFGNPSNDDESAGSGLVVLGDKTDSPVTVDLSLDNKSPVRDATGKHRGWWIQGIHAGDHFGEGSGSVVYPAGAQIMIGAIDGQLPNTPEVSGYIMVLDSSFLTKLGDKPMPRDLIDLDKQTDKLTLVSGPQKESRLGRSMGGMNVTDKNFLFFGGAPASFSEIASPLVVLRTIDITSESEPTPNPKPDIKPASPKTETSAKPAVVKKMSLPKSGV